ncbi:hypothetical protein GVN16_18170 [Emticicia sp. CRIBPO]|uniref:hypothetical protein n=1 Tax=Emticicia sp. CRIBPO TaxID=2683258 RepID=UPI0014123D20|nr:hypothetical protein [Emticicia sp. CRIBPO]NBA87702.1 hypothetical protein [Emticicia sp. CRIBPO]
MKTHLFKVRTVNFFYLVCLFSSCSFFGTEFKETKMIKPGMTQELTVLPHKDQNNVVIIRYESMTNTNYQLKVEFYYGKNLPPNSTESINIPNGTVNGEWRRDFYGDRANGRVVVTYLPEHYDANGEVRLFTAIE